MTSFFGAIRHCLRNLVSFRGRDSRAQFWFYVLALGIAQQIVTGILGVWLITTHFRPIDSATSAADAGRSVADSARWIMFMSFAMTGAGVALLAAAIVRRLHDRGLSGRWAALPLPFLVSGLVFMGRLFATFSQSDEGFDGRLFGLGFANNVIYLLTVLVLVVLLVKESDGGENRFGPPPML